MSPRSSHESNLKRIIRRLAKSPNDGPEIAAWIKTSGAVTAWGLRIDPRHLLTTRSLQELAGVLENYGNSFSPETTAALHSLLTYAAKMDNNGIRIDPAVPRDKWRAALVAVRRPILHKQLTDPSKAPQVDDLEMLLDLPLGATADREMDLFLAHRIVTRQPRNHSPFADLRLAIEIELMETAPEETRLLWAGTAHSTLHELAGGAASNPSPALPVDFRSPDKRAEQAEKILATMIGLLDQGRPTNQETELSRRQALLTSCVELAATASGWNPELLLRVADIKNADGSTAFDDTEQAALRLAALYGMHFRHDFTRARGSEPSYRAFGNALGLSLDRTTGRHDLSKLLDEVVQRADILRTLHRERSEPEKSESVAAETLQLLHASPLMTLPTGRTQKLTRAGGLALRILDDRWNNEIANVAIRHHASLNDLDSVISIASRLRTIALEQEIPSQLHHESVEALIDAIQPKAVYRSGRLRKLTETLFPPWMSSENDPGIFSFRPHDGCIVDADTRAKVMGVLFVQAADEGDRESLDLICDFAWRDQAEPNEPVKAIGALCSAFLDDQEQLIRFVTLSTDNNHGRSVRDIIVSQLKSSRETTRGTNSSFKIDPWVFAHFLRHGETTLAARLHTLVTSQTLEPTVPEKPTGRQPFHREGRPSQL